MRGCDTDGRLRPRPGTVLVALALALAACSHERDPRKDVDAVLRRDGGSGGTQHGSAGAQPAEAQATATTTPSPSPTPNSTPPPNDVATPDLAAVRRQLDQVQDRLDALRDEGTSAKARSGPGEERGSRPAHPAGGSQASGRRAPSSGSSGALQALCREVVGGGAPSSAGRRDRHARAGDATAAHRSPGDRHVAALRQEVHELRRAVARLDGEASPGQESKPADAARKKPARSADVEGLVASASHDRMLVRSPDGALVLLRVPADARVSREGKPMDASGLREGMKVRASYDVRGGEQRATDVEVVGK